MPSLNKASATVLFRLLGGSLIRETGGRIEPVLRDLVIEIARPMRPSNWDDLVARLDQLVGYVPNNPLNEALDAINEANIPGAPKLPTQARHELEILLEALADDIWDEALYRRDQLWALPWPPQPRPSRKFLQSLIAAVWTYSANLQGEDNAAFVELAIIQLHGAQGLGKVQQAIAWEAIATGIAIGAVAAAGIGAGIGLVYCIFANCFGLRDGLIKAFRASGDDDPTPMPATRPKPKPRPDDDDDADDPDTGMDTPSPEPTPDPDDPDAEPGMPERPRPRPLPEPGPAAPVDRGLQPPSWWNPTPPDPLPGPGPLGKPVDRGPKSPRPNLPEPDPAVQTGGTCPPHLFNFQRFTNEAPHVQGACIVIRVPTGRVGWTYSCELMFTYPEVHFKGRNAGVGFAQSAASLGANSCFYSLVGSRQFSCFNYSTCIQAAMLASGFIGAKVENKCNIPVKLTYCPPLH